MKRERVRLEPPSASPVTLEQGGAVEVSDVYVRSLIRSQLRIALACLAAFAGLTALLVLGVYALPSLGQWQLAGQPVSWLLLGLGVYPIIVATALIFARSAAKNERAYLELSESTAP